MIGCSEGLGKYRQGLVLPSPSVDSAAVAVLEPTGPAAAPKRNPKNQGWKDIKTCVMRCLEDMGKGERFPLLLP